MKKLRDVPQVQGMDVEHYQFLTEVRNAVVQLQSSTLPPDDPTNLKATPFATGINVQFTRSRNAHRYTLYIANSAPNRSAASSSGSIAIDLGDTNYYNDIVGQSNFTRFYWVRAWNGNVGSRVVGPVKGVTAASGTVADPPKQVPPGTIALDQATGLPVSGRPIITPGGGGQREV